MRFLPGGLPRAVADALEIIHEPSAQLLLLALGQELDRVDPVHAERAGIAAQLAPARLAGRRRGSSAAY
jgi:hypothetical protein